MKNAFFYIEIISFLKLRLISFNILFVSLLRLSFRFFFLFKRELVKLCVSRNHKCVVLLTFDLICLLILGGEHIEGIDLFSTTTFGKFPWKIVLHIESLDSIFGVFFWDFFCYIRSNIFSWFFIFFIRLFAWLLLNLTFGKESFW